MGEGWKNVNDGNITVNLGTRTDFQVSSSVKLIWIEVPDYIDNYNQLILSAGVIFAF